jgi:hypothetical protein
MTTTALYHGGRGGGKTTSRIHFISHVDRPDGTRYVMRRHVWGFSETVLTREDGEKWKTLSHREYRFSKDLKETAWPKNS